MHKLLQVNVTANSGSTGKIAEAIGQQAISRGWESWIAYGRGTPQSASSLIRIGNDWDMRWHGVETRLLDNHGLASRRVTRHFIRQIKEINPDIIHLHNIHGYYLNYPLLFQYLKEWGGPVVWTLHDCWPYTGHCAYYDFAGCDRWKTGCNNCPQLKSYPSALFIDRSKRNYADKRNAFTGCHNMHLIAVSDWLNIELNKSFLKDYPIYTIRNGIDLSVFKPAPSYHNDGNSKFILGVANVWETRKGLDEFYKLRNLLPHNYNINLIGLSKSQISALPNGITGITHTENINQLAELYAKADIFINPTLEDNFPTTNLEALACGTPVITYNTGGSPEAIDSDTGIVVNGGDIDGLAAAVIKITKEKDKYTSEQCRTRALTYFDKDICFKKYFDLYDSLLKQ